MLTRAQRRELQEQQRSAKALARMGDSAAELLLLRHGETPWNVEHRLQGQALPGPPLNALGHAQAEAAARALAAPGEGRLADGQQLPIAAVYCSDLLRAVQTADVAAQALGCKVTQLAELRERHVGALQGLTHQEAAAQQPQAHRALCSGDPRERVAGGESLEDMQARIVAALQAIAARHPGGRVLVVTHGGCLQAVHRHSRGCLYPGKLGNGSLSSVHIQGAAWAIAAWNDGRHLAGCQAQDGDGFGGGVGEA